MCSSSVRNRECKHGQNCPDGYHIQNTKKVVASNNRTHLNARSPNTLSNMEGLRGTSRRMAAHVEEEFPALPNTNTYNKTRLTNQQYNEAAQVRSQRLNPRTNYRSVVQNQPDNAHGQINNPAVFGMGQACAQIPLVC